MMSSYSFLRLSFNLISLLMFSSFDPPRAFRVIRSLVPVTILRAGPCTVTQIKTAETDGYNAVQLGYAQVSSKILNKPQIGHLEKVGVPLLRYLHEYKVSDTNELTLGQNLGVDIFERFEL